jgi:DnaK suppressor protein
MRQDLLGRVNSLSNDVESRHDCEIQNAGDSASFHEAHDRAVIMSNRHQQEILEIDAALRRIAEGRYGFSESTGEPISFERLLAIPWARTGMDG